MSPRRKPARRARPLIETFEPRCLLSATTISGTVFFDRNWDGVQQSDDTPLGAGVVIAADVDGDGQFNPGDASVPIDSAGHYTLNLPGGGDYSLILYFSTTGLRTTSQAAPPADHVRSVIVGDGANVGGVDWGVNSTSLPGPNDVWGSAFFDANHNGTHDPDEHALYAVPWIDLNGNGILDGPYNPSAEKSLSGGESFAFNNLPAGTYTIGLAGTGGAGTSVQFPAPRTTFQVTLPRTAGPNGFSYFDVPLPFDNYAGDAKGGTITGTVYYDLDQNAARGADEGVVGNFPVFLDYDNDGFFDYGEPRSEVDPSTGLYTFANLPAGTYHVRPVGQYEQDLRQTAPGANAARVVTVGAGQTVGGADFGGVQASVPPPDGAGVDGAVFFDADGDGVHSAGDTGVAGATVFVDRNQNGVLDATDDVVHSDKSGNYRIPWLAAGTYSIVETQAAPAVAARSAAVGVRSPAAGSTSTIKISVKLGKAQVVHGLDFKTGAAAPTKGTISGTVYKDANSNGAVDAGEAGQASITVYLDANKNGSKDAGEASVLTGAGGAYQFTALAPAAYTVRQVMQANYKQTLPAADAAVAVTVVAGGNATGRNFAQAPLPVSPPPPPPPPPGGASVNGTLVNDANSNGVRDAGEAALANWTVFLDLNKNGALDAAEPKTTTSASGAYAFLKLAAGAYRVREVVQAGWRSTNTNGLLDFSLAANQVAGNKVFANTQRALVAGTVFSDVNANGKRDAGEAALAGWKLWLDTDNDGVLDANERFATTDASGNFAFKDLVAGSYHVRVLKQAGFAFTLPAAGTAAMTVVAGQNASGRLFGARKI